MKNVDIRREMLASGVKHWQVAQEIGVADGTFSRRLRNELSDEDKAEIRAAIERLSKEV